MTTAATGTQVLLFHGLGADSSVWGTADDPTSFAGIVAGALGPAGEIRPVPLDMGLLRFGRDRAAMASLAEEAASHIADASSHSADVALVGYCLGGTVMVRALEEILIPRTIVLLDVPGRLSASAEPTPWLAGVLDFVGLDVDDLSLASTQLRELPTVAGSSRVWSVSSRAPSWLDQLDRTFGAPPAQCALFDSTHEELVGSPDVRKEVAAFVARAVRIPESSCGRTTTRTRLGKPD